MKKLKRFYLIGLWAFLPVLTSCEPNANGSVAKMPSTYTTEPNQWQSISAQIENPSVPSNASKSKSFLKTTVKAPSGLIDLEIRCNNHLVQVIIHLNQNEVATTPVYSNIDAKWSHTFHVDFMNSTKNVNERLPARQNAQTTSSYIVSNVLPSIFLGPESHLKFQTLPRNSITVFYDEHVRALARACIDSS